MIEYRVFNVGTETSQLEKAEGEFLSLDDMYYIIDCDIVEFIYLKDNQIMIIDEEGKFKQETNAINLGATEVVRKTYENFDDYVAGNAILIDRKYLR
jgi:hypothetical protein